MTKRYSRAKMKLALAIASIPFVCSIVAHAAGSVPKPLAVQTPAALSFTQYLVDKGLVDPVAQADARFGFVNRGITPLIISKLTASCGCLQPVVMVGDEIYRPDENDNLRLPVPPGEQGMILLRVQMANQEPGDKEYSVTVHTHAVGSEQSQQADLAFHLKIPTRGVFVRPQSMVLYQHGGAFPAGKEPEIVVSDMRNLPLRVQGVSCPSDLIQLRVEDSVIDENGVCRTAIKVLPQENIPPGKHVTVVKIYTDDPANAELRVPLWIYGPQPESSTMATRPAPAKQ